MSVTTTNFGALKREKTAKISKKIALQSFNLLFRLNKNQSYFLLNQRYDIDTPR